MSYQTPDGLPTEMPRSALHEQRFLAEIQQSWAGEDRRRMRDLAAVVLHANGWKLEMISQALGWQERSSARKAIQRTKRSLRAHLSEHNHGFSNPDDPQG